MERATYENSQAEGGLRSRARLKKVGRMLFEVLKSTNLPPESSAREAGRISLKAL